MYSLIAKKVEGDQVVELRFLDMETKGTVDVPYAAVKDFMLNNRVTNAKYENNNISFKWQDLYSLPNYREDGTVSTYLFKVVTDRVSNEDWLVANALGSVTKVSCKNLTAMLDMVVHSMVVYTLDRVMKFSMGLDGKYTSKQITDDMIGFMDEKIVKSFNTEYKMNYCECEGENCYYYHLRLGEHKLIGFGSFNNTNITYVQNHMNGYKLKSASWEKKLDNYPEVLLNKAHINVYHDVYFGIDGLTFIGKGFDNFNPNELKEQYERMLALDPVNAEILKKGIMLGSAGELLGCNLALCTIPDGVEKVAEQSLYFDYAEHGQRYKEAKREGDLHLVIPGSVKEFSSVAIKRNARFYNNGMYKHANITIENPDIAGNVINALLESGYMFGNVIANGSVKVSHSLVRRVFNTLDRRNFIADNVKIKKVINTQVDKFMDTELGGYQVMPYLNKLYKGYYPVIMLDTKEDFDTVYKDWERKLRARYDSLKKQIAHKFDENYIWNKSEYNAIFALAQNLYFEYKEYTKMLMHTAIKEGDSAEYKKLVDSAYKRREYLYQVFNKELLLVAIKCGFKHVGKHSL